MPVPSSNRRLLLWVGLLLMSGGLALTVVFIGFLLLGGPLFLVGLGLVLFSGQPWWARGLAVVAPFAGWVGVVEVVGALAPRAPAITFLVPEGFEGTVTLVLNEACGQPAEKLAGRLVYRVPANGLLISQNKAPNLQSASYQYPHKGYFEMADNAYYLVNRQGQRLRQLTEARPPTAAGEPAEPTTAWASVGNDELAAFPDSPFETSPDAHGVAYTLQTITFTTPAHYFHPLNPDQSWQQRQLADSLVQRCRARNGSPLLPPPKAIIKR